MTKKQRHDAEFKLLDKLIKSYGYRLTRIRQPRDRYVYAFNFIKGTGSMKYAMTLVVPKDSALGEAMIKSDKASDKTRCRKTRPK